VVAAVGAVLAILWVSSPAAVAPSATGEARSAPVDSPKGSAPKAEKSPGEPRSSVVDDGGSSRKRLAREKRSGRAGFDGRSGSPAGPPPTVTSHYLKTSSRTTLHRLGCGEARSLRTHRNVPDALAVLVFGRPRHHRGRFGASLFGERFISTDGVERAGRAYARGYAACAGSRTPRLEVALGTSNYGSAVGWPHGRAWARMVNRANDWLDGQGLHRFVRFAGGSDIELGWNGPAVSRRWVRGYDSVARWRFYNFGDAAGCAPRGNCSGAWTQEDVWFVSWGARSAWPLPQIYTPSGSMAQQWYRLSLYSSQRHGQRMTIVGALSQRQACRQSSDSCWGINNSPRRAWRQLQRLLNGNPRTAQPLAWLTDLRWQN
jgi:hypothetical protein